MFVCFSVGGLGSKKDLLLAASKENIRDLFPKAVSPRIAKLGNFKLGVHACSRKGLSRREFSRKLGSTEFKLLLIEVRKINIIIPSSTWCMCVCISISVVSDSATEWTVAHQAPLSMGSSRQECWSGLPCPSPGDLPDPGIKPRSPALQADSLPFESSGKPPPSTWMGVFVPSDRT